MLTVSVCPICGGARDRRHGGVGRCRRSCHVWPKEQATIGNLYAALHREQSAVTQLARRMENRRLITRELSSSDARVRYLKLTSRVERRLSDTVIALKGERDRLLGLVSKLDGAAA